MITNNQPLNAQLLIVSLKEMSLSCERLTLGGSNKSWCRSFRRGSSACTVLLIASANRSLSRAVSWSVLPSDLKKSTLSVKTIKILNPQM